MSHSYRQNRFGFTLLELMIVLIIMGIILGLAMPNILQMYRRHEVKAAAQQVRAELAEARVNAVEQGETYLFRFRPGTGEYEIGPAPQHDAASSLLANIGANNAAISQQTADQFTMGGPGQMNDAAGILGSETSGSSSSNQTSDSIEGLMSVGENETSSAYTSSGPLRKKLPQGILFAGTEIAESTKANDPTESESNPLLVAALTSSASGAAGEAGWSEPIVFHPNGRCSSATIRLERWDGARCYAIDLSLRGLTGGVLVGRLRSFDPDADKAAFQQAQGQGVPMAGPGASGSSSSKGGSLLDVAPLPMPTTLDNPFASSNAAYGDPFGASSNNTFPDPFGPPSSDPFGGPSAPSLSYEDNPYGNFALPQDDLGDETEKDVSDPGTVVDDPYAASTSTFEDGPDSMLPPIPAPGARGQDSNLLDDEGWSYPSDVGPGGWDSGEVGP